MTQHVFGPVPSRRLGISLGIDLVPHKICSMDCLYCECGPTTKKTLERLSYIDKNQVIREVQTAIGSFKLLDYMTLSGAGEPTLNQDLGWVIREIRKLTAIPIAVITNSSLLGSPDVQSDLEPADLVMPSLDAVTPDLFEKINQPCAALAIETIISGLIAFRDVFPGQMWLEVLVVRGLNDQPEEWANLHRTINKIRPDRVQLNSLDRPPAYPGTQGVEMNILQRIKDLWRDLPVEIIRRFHRREEIIAFDQKLEDMILETARRRPLLLEDLEALTGIDRDKLRQYLDILEKERKIKPQIQSGHIFFTALTR